MTQSISRRQLLALTTSAVAPASIGQEDDAAAAIHAVMARLRRRCEALCDYYDAEGFYKQLATAGGRQ